MDNSQVATRNSFATDPSPPPDDHDLAGEQLPPGRRRVDGHPAKAIDHVVAQFSRRHALAFEPLPGRFAGQHARQFLQRDGGKFLFQLRRRLPDPSRILRAGLAHGQNRHVQLGPGFQKSPHPVPRIFFGLVARVLAPNPVRAGQEIPAVRGGESPAADAERSTRRFAGSPSCPPEPSGLSPEAIEAESSPPGRPPDGRGSHRRVFPVQPRPKSSSRTARYRADGFFGNRPIPGSIWSRRTIVAGIASFFANISTNLASSLLACPRV